MNIISEDERCDDFRREGRRGRRSSCGCSSSTPINKADEGTTFIVASLNLEMQL